MEIVLFLPIWIGPLIRSLASTPFA